MGGRPGGTIGHAIATCFSWDHGLSRSDHACQAWGTENGFVVRIVQSSRATPVEILVVQPVNPLALWPWGLPFAFLSVLLSRPQDDWGWGDSGFNTGINGQSHTPSLDRLATTGVTFSDFQ